MSFSTIRSLISAGDLVLWHDYRSGHTGNLAGYSTGVTADGSIEQSQGYLRSGRGFVTGVKQDFEGVADPTSVGYVKVVHSALLVPPAGGCCVIASYIADSYVGSSHIIGMGQYGTPAAACWELLRDDRAIRFATSDGENEDDFQWIVAPTLGTIETVSARYTGGTGPNNCTIKMHAPAIVDSTGTIDKVPADVDISLQVCAQSGGELQPFAGVMRYVAFIRGAQTQAVLDAVVAEMEAFVWQNDPMRFDRDGKADPRRLQYGSRFGVDALRGATALAQAEISNSGWILTETLNAGVDESGSATLDIVHHDGVATWALPDIDKVLEDNWATGGDPGRTTLHLPRTRLPCTPAEAAYGTWDWWMYPVIDPDGADPRLGFWIVASSPDHLAGYEVRVDAGGTLTLQEWAAGVATQLATTAANVIPMDAWTHFRVTRDSGTDEIKVFYDTGAGWTLAFAVTDGTVTTSEYMVWGGGTDTYGSRLGLGNHCARRSVFKWAGVVNPLPDPT